MIHKEWLPAGLWDKGIQSASMVDITAKGNIDKDKLNKIAADETILRTSINPQRGYSYIHLITTGAGEHWGSNSNSDYFNESAKVVNFPYMNKTASLDGGLTKYHDTTYKNMGAVYRNHNNRNKGAKPEGSIEVAHYNPLMHRGELIVKLANDKWATELEKIANNEPVYFSQGCGVKTDYCSVCGNARKKLNETCEHLRFYKNAVDENGNQVYAINDAPMFHDISCVDKPADRIAFALAKVASDVTDTYEAPELWLPLSFVKGTSTFTNKRREILDKLAKMEKEVNCMIDGGFDSFGKSLALPEEDDEKVVNGLKDLPMDDIMKVMHGNGMMMSPKQFTMIIIKKNPDSPELSGLGDSLQNIFSKLHDELPEDVLNDGTYEGVPGFVPAATSVKIKTLKPELSTDASDVEDRVVKSELKKGDKKEKKMEKKAADSFLCDKIAREYAKYQITCIANEKNKNIFTYCLGLNRSI